MRKIIVMILLLPFVYAAVPVIEDVSIQPQVFLISGGSVTLFCNATVTDADGYQDISSASAEFFDMHSSYYGAHDDNNDHYSDSSCRIHGSGLQANLSCSFRVWYYANPSDWICNVSVFSGKEGSFDFNATVVESLMSIDVDSLSYHNDSGGSIPNGRVSAESVMEIENLGNVGVNIDVSGTDMECTLGMIQVRNQKYSTTPGFIWEGGISLTGRAATIGKFTVPQRTDDSLPSISELYWRILIPEKGVGGNCSGTMNVDGG